MVYGKPWRVGFSSCLDRNGGGIVIMDYESGIAPTALRLHYPRFRVTLDRPIAPRSVVVFKQKAEAAWMQIVKAADADDFPKKPGPLCNWCDFQAFCPGEPPADFPRKSR